MPPRPEDEAVHGSGVPLVEVSLVDVEPFAGLISATSRFCTLLTREAIAAMPEEAVHALSDMQAVMWRIEHTPPDPTSKPREPKE